MLNSRNECEAGAKETGRKEKGKGRRGKILPTVFWRLSNPGDQGVKWEERKEEKRPMQKQWEKDFPSTPSLPFLSLPFLQKEGGKGEREKVGEWMERNFLDLAPYPTF